MLAKGSQENCNANRVWQMVAPSEWDLGQTLERPLSTAAVRQVVRKRRRNNWIFFGRIPWFSG